MKSIYHSKFKLALAITTGGWQLLLVMYLMYIHCKSGFDTKILTRASEGGAMYFLIGEHMQRLKKKDWQKKQFFYLVFLTVKNLWTISRLFHPLPILLLVCYWTAKPGIKLFFVNNSFWVHQISPYVILRTLLYVAKCWEVFLLGGQLCLGDRNSI